MNELPHQNLLKEATITRLKATNRFIDNLVWTSLQEQDVNMATGSHT